MGGRQVGRRTFWSSLGWGVCEDRFLWVDGTRVSCRLRWGGVSRLWLSSSCLLKCWSGVA